MAPAPLTAPRLHPPRLHDQVCPHEMRGLEAQMQDVERQHNWDNPRERVSGVVMGADRVIGGRDAADSAVIEDDDEALEL